jgi:hypothetical protein
LVLKTVPFCPGKILSQKNNLWAKTMAEHGSGETKEAQTLLSKKDKIFNLKQRGKILYQSQDNLQ